MAPDRNAGWDHANFLLANRPRKTKERDWFLGTVILNGRFQGYLADFL